MEEAALSFNYMHMDIMDKLILKSLLFPVILDFFNYNLKDQTRARIYQVTNGGNKGQQITSVPATLQDLTNKVWIDFVSSGTSSFTYQVKDSCLACSTTNYTVSVCIYLFPCDPPRSTTKLPTKHLLLRILDLFPFKRMEIQLSSSLELIPKTETTS